MSKSLLYLLLTATTLPTSVKADVELPQPRFSANAALAGNASDLLLTQSSNTAGSVSVSFGGGGVSTTVGADKTKIPFVSVDGSTNDRLTASASASAAMYYNWAVVGTANFDELVPVTITTLGNFSAELTARSLLPTVPVKASVNWLDIAIISKFETWSIGGLLDTQNFGIYSGSSHFGNGIGTAITFEDLVSQPGFSSVSARGAASFIKTFTILAQPNQLQSISMFALGQEGGSTWYGAPGYSTEVAYNYTFHAYMDPIITIDPAYTNRFSVIQSNIPVVAVPEPSTYVLLLVGLGLLYSRRARR